MNVLIKYKINCNKKIDDIILYCDVKSTIKDIESKIKSIIEKDCEILYIKF